MMLSFAFQDVSQELLLHLAGGYSVVALGTMNVVASLSAPRNLLLHASNVTGVIVTAIISAALASIVAYGAAIAATTVALLALHRLAHESLLRR
ncbi:MAG: hypothetical protein ACREOK_15265 [Gemmatimonadaceae bacterium]